MLFFFRVPLSVATINREFRFRKLSHTEASPLRVAQIIILRWLRFTHPTHFRSTPSWSEYKVCSTSGFANAHPEVKHASTLPESLCWFRFPFSSSVCFPFAGFAPGGSAAEKKSLFDTLVGTLVETSEGGFAPPCGSKIRDKPECMAL